MADLKDGGLLTLLRDMNLKEYDNLSHFNFTLFEIWPCSREKTVPFKRTLDHTHSFTNGNIYKCHHTTLLLSSHVSLSAMLDETHSVVKLSLLP